MNDWFFALWQLIQSSLFAKYLWPWFAVMTIGIMSEISELAFHGIGVFSIWIFYSKQLMYNRR